MRRQESEWVAPGVRICGVALANMLVNELVNVLVSMLVNVLVNVDRVDWRGNPCALCLSVTIPLRTMSIRYDTPAHYVYAARSKDTLTFRYRRQGNEEPLIAGRGKLSGCVGGERETPHSGEGEALWVRE